MIISSTRQAARKALWGPSLIADRLREKVEKFLIKKEQANIQPERTVPGGRELSGEKNILHSRQKVTSVTVAFQ